MNSSNRKTRIGVCAAMVCALSASCGYHVAGKADLVPKTVHTIAIPAFGNITTRYKLTDHLPQAISHEFIARTRYQVINDQNAADAILRGAVISYFAYPTTIDQVTGRAAGLQVIVTMQVSLVERATGKVLFTRPSFDFRQRYEISTTSTTAYFDESDAGLERLSRDVARDVVTAILEGF
ncbi:MAG TPA: LptE family protein [Bryobacteraceae bacterium]|nr:LptE family protein [Bryobacteraceae bacterium]